MELGMQKQNLYSAGSVSVLPLTEASWRMEQETEGGGAEGRWESVNPVGEMEPGWPQGLLF